jgi:hypothetical protein
MSHNDLVNGVFWQKRGMILFECLYHHFYLVGSGKSQYLPNIDLFPVGGAGPFTSNR